MIKQTNHQRVALDRAFDRFSRRYPSLEAAFFDRQFIRQQLEPLLVENRGCLEARRVATAWARQLSRNEARIQRLATYALRATSYFIEQVELEREKAGPQAFAAVAD